MTVIALIVAAALLVVGGFAVALADWRAIPSGSPGRGIERLWVVLPALFVIALVVFSALEGLG